MANSDRLLRSSWRKGLDLLWGVGGYTQVWGSAFQAHLSGGWPQIHSLDKGWAQFCSCIHVNTLSWWGPEWGGGVMLLTEIRYPREKPRARCNTLRPSWRAPGNLSHSPLPFPASSQTLVSVLFYAWIHLSAQCGHSGVDSLALSPGTMVLPTPCRHLAKSVPPLTSI